MIVIERFGAQYAISKPSARNCGYAQTHESESERPASTGLGSNVMEVHARGSMSTRRTKGEPRSTLVLSCAGPFRQARDDESSQLERSDRNLEKYIMQDVRCGLT